MTAIQQLGPVVLPQPNAGVEAQTARQADLAETGLLTTDTVDVEQLTNQAGDLSLSGRYRPPYIPADRVQMVADEFESLIAGSLGPLPLFDQTDPTATSGQTGWYEVADGSVSPAHPSQPDVQEWSISLSRVGSRGTHWRAVRTAPIDPNNAFTATSARGETIYLPQSARKPQWYDAESGTTTPASVATTRNLRDVSVDGFDITNGPGSAPTLLYEVPYDDDVAGVYAFLQPSGVNLRYDDNGNRNWPAIFNTGADIAPTTGTLVIDTRGCTFAINTAAPVIKVREWDNSQDEYVELSPGPFPTNWSPLDADLVDIGVHRVVADITFEDGSDTYTLRVRLRFGAERPTFSPAPRESDPVPTELVDFFDPVHGQSQTIAQPTRDVVARRDLR